MTSLALQTNKLGITMRRFFYLCLLTVAILAMGVPAQAHTQDEYDAWVAEWSKEVLDSGGLKMSVLEEFYEMQDRHPCLAEYCAPKPVAPPVQTTVPVPVPVPTIPPPALDPTPAPTPAPAPSPTYGAGVEQWRGLVEAYFPASGVTWAMRVMKCESGGDPNAKNPSSSASGLFQHLARYWDDRSAKAGWGGSDIFDPEANIAVAAWLYSGGSGAGHWVCK